MNMYDGKSSNDFITFEMMGICIKAYSMFYLDTKRDYLSR